MEKGRWLFGFAVAVGLVFCVVTMRTPSHTELFPLADKAWQGARLYSYDDRGEGGGSMHFRDSASGAFRMRWRLDTGLAYPYVGGGLSWIRAGKPCVDWQDYDSLVVRWRLKGSGIARFALHTLDSLHSDKSDMASLRILMVVVPVDSGWRSSRLALRDWVTPPWWYSNRRVIPNAEDRYMDQVCEIEWDIPGVAGQRKEGDLEVASLVLVRAQNRWSLVCWGVFTVLLLLWGLWEWRRFAKAPGQSRRITLPQETDIGKIVATPGDWEQLSEYLQEHYCTSELGAEAICRHFGWNATKFTAIVKEGSGTHFKQLLNRMRIRKACRLLKETGEPVNCIADQCGFANVTHFNRVFRELEGCSPGVYRNNTKA